MANPRQSNNQKLIFRRGYLYMEGIDQNLKSGLLFISFQKDIGETFESIKKNTLSNSYVSNPEKVAYNNHLKDETVVKSSFNNINLGGGYYFIPPIPNKKISNIGQEYFE